MLTKAALNCLVWARGLWSELHEHECLEPALLDGYSEEDFDLVNQVPPREAYSKLQLCDGLEATQ